MVVSRPSSKLSQRESAAPPMEVPRQNMATVITESTSQESGLFRPAKRPPPSDWGDRLRLQRARNGALLANRTTEIPDQEVVFQGSCPYDMRERSPPPGGGVNPTTGSVVKQGSLHSTQRGDKLVTIRTRRAQFISNTSITPMSQQHYPGRLNPNCDPLIGPRFVTITEEEHENGASNRGSRESSRHSEQRTSRDVTSVGRCGQEGHPVERATPALRAPSPSRRQPSPRMTLLPKGPSPARGRTRSPTRDYRMMSAIRTLPPPRLPTQQGWDRDRQLRGFSMPAANRPPTISTGKRDVDQHYRESMLSRLMNTITEVFIGGL
jgi:hypothetical protein